jgi:hypothetical protein
MIGAAVRFAHDATLLRALHELLLELVRFGAFEQGEKKRYTESWTHVFFFSKISGRHIHRRTLCCYGRVLFWFCFQDFYRRRRDFVSL